MATVAITDQAIRRTKPLPGCRIELWDAFVPGFGYRATKPGAGSFFVMFRLEGAQRRQTLGRYPALSLEAARAAARAALAEARQGIDPQLRQAAEQALAQAQYDRTVKLAVTDFLNLYPRYRPSTRAEVGRLFKREVVPAIGALPIGAVSRKEIAAVINAVADRGHITTANRLHSYLQAFFGWLVMRGEIEARPLANLAKPGPENAKDRVLSEVELIAVWQAAQAMGYPFGTVVQLLILTAQRRSEVAGMQHVDIDISERAWTLPKEQTKNNRGHQVPLSTLAIQVLASVPRTPSPLVFPAQRQRQATKGQDRHLSGWSTYKRQLDAKVRAELSGDIAPWTLHDLRRTVASGMAARGIAPHVIERLLNHSTGAIRGVAAVYNRHSYAPEMRVAIGLWSEVITSAIEKCRVRSMPDTDTHSSALTGNAQSIKSAKLNDKSVT